MADSNSNLIVYVNPDPNNPTDTNGGLYSIPPSTYTDKTFAMPQDVAGEALVLLSDGTVVANIPDDGTGSGGWCYLINLPALKPPSVDVGQDTKALQTSARPSLTPTQILNAVGTLLKRTKPAPGSPDAKIQAALQALVNANAPAPQPAAKTK